jgi:hypothetical protein
MTDMAGWSTVAIHVLADSKVGSGQQKMNVRTLFSPRETWRAVVRMINAGVKGKITCSSILQKK